MQEFWVFLNHFFQITMLFKESGNIENTSLESFDRVMNVNLRAVFLSTQLAVPFLEKTKGSVVNVSSVNGIRSVGFYIFYTFNYIICSFQTFLPTMSQKLD